MLWPKTSRSLAGAAWLLAGGACVVAMQTIARHVAQDMPSIQMVFFRFLFGMMFMAPWLLHAGIASVRTRMWRHYFIRAIGTLIILTCVYTALAEIPVADVAALQFTAPIFITIGAGIFLKERIGVRRWAAVAIGFMGTLLILRPGMSAVSPVALLVLVGAFFNATVMLLTKVLSRTEAAKHHRVLPDLAGHDPGVPVCALGLDAAFLGIACMYGGNRRGGHGGATLHNARADGGRCVSHSAGELHAPAFRSALRLFGLRRSA